MYGFSAKEEAFIEASIEVIVRGAELYEAEQRMREAAAPFVPAVEEAIHRIQAAQEAAQPYGEELGFDGSQDDLARINILLREAARRGGFDDDHEVVKALDEAAAQVADEINLLERINAASSGVISIEDLDL